VLDKMPSWSQREAKMICGSGRSPGVESRTRGSSAAIDMICPLCSLLPLWAVKLQKL
jgi:hypothetical protein